MSGFVRLARAAGLATAATLIAAGPAGAYFGVGEVTALPSGDAPSGLVAAADGTLFAIDRGRIDHLSAAGALIAQWGSPGKDPGQLDGPQELAVDPHGDVAVTETVLGRVQTFTPAGHLIASRTADSPEGIAFDAADNLYLGDARGVTEYGPTGQTIRQLALPQSPFDLALSPSGDIYAAIAGQDSIWRLDRDGGATTYVGSKGYGLGQFGDGAGVGVDKMGNLWTADGSGNRVEEFNPEGAFIRACGFGAVTSPFEGPFDVAIATNGHVYVTGGDHHGGYVVTQLHSVSTPATPCARPVLSHVKLSARRLGLVLSEPATITITATPVAGSHRRARRTSYSRSTGHSALRLSSLLPAHVASGQWRLTVVARDSSGNRSAAKHIELRVASRL